MYIELSSLVWCDLHRLMCRSNAIYYVTFRFKCFRLRVETVRWECILTWKCALQSNVLELQFLLCVILFCQYTRFGCKYFFFLEFSSLFFLIYDVYWQRCDDFKPIRSVAYSLDACAPCHQNSIISTIRFNLATSN